jgi:hypothetical protein
LADAIELFCPTIVLRLDDPGERGLLTATNLHCTSQCWSAALSSQSPLRYNADRLFVPEAPGLGSLGG